MDLRLPGMGGVEATIAIRKEFPEARVIVLTTFDIDEDIFRAMDSGAKSYLLKDTSEDELAETIRAVHAGQEKLAPKEAERLVARQRRPELSHGQGAPQDFICEAWSPGPDGRGDYGHPAESRISKAKII